MVIDITLSMLDRNRPLVIKARREKNTSISQEEPVGIRDTHINLPPGAVVARSLVAEHSTPLRANLGDMHRHIKFINDAHIAIGQLFREADSMGVGVVRENLCERHQSGAHRHRITVEGPKVQYFLVVNMAHHFLAPPEGANRHTTANRLGQTDEIGLHWIQFCDASWGNRYAGFYLIEDEQHIVPARNFTQAPQISFFG